MTPREILEKIKCTKCSLYTSDPTYRTNCKTRNQTECYIGLLEEQNALMLEALKEEMKVVCITCINKEQDICRSPCYQYEKMQNIINQISGEQI